MELDPATGLLLVQDEGRLLHSVITFIEAIIVVTGNYCQVSAIGPGKLWDQKPLSLPGSGYMMATK